MPIFLFNAEYSVAFSFFTLEKISHPSCFLFLTKHNAHTTKFDLAMTNWTQLKTLYFLNSARHDLSSPQQYLKWLFQCWQQRSTGTVHYICWRCFSARFAVSLDLEVGNNPLRDVVPRKSFVNFGFRLLSLKLWLDSESILQQRCAPHSAVQCWSGSNCVVIPRIWKEFIIFPQIHNLTSQQKSFKQQKKNHIF